MKKPVRWKQRFQNFEKAFRLLQEAVAQKKYTKLEEAGLVQAFEFTFELAWKTLKDKLESEGFDTPSPRQTIKQAFQSSYIQNGHVWMDALEKCNLMAHIYDEKRSEEVIELIKEKYFSMLESLFHFLSSHKDE